MVTQKGSTLDRILYWLDERLGIYGHTLRQAPRYAYSIDYWLGGFVLASLIFEIITGALTALYYTPSDPYTSTTYLISQVPYGALLFSLHSWGAYVMIFAMLVHITRNFIVGAYRPPREFMWIVGTLLAGLTLTEAYLGYSLPYNLISWVATTTGLNLFGYMPFNLGYLISLFTIVNPNQPGIMSGVDPLVQRFFVFHWIVGGLLVAVVGLHLYIFEKHGITPPVSEVKPGAPELIDEYQDKLKSDYRWELQPLIRSIGMVVMIFLLTFGIIFFIASMIPFDISVSGTVLKYVKPEYNPINAAQAPPLPDWYFLFIYFFYKAIDPSSASIIFLGWVAVTVLFPFIDAYVFRHKAPHPGLRPAAVSLGTGFIIAFIVNTIWAEETPGQEIGTIGLVVDAIIFIACFAVLWPLLRYVVQPRVLAKMSSSPFRDGGIMTIKPEKRVLSGALVLSMNLFILGTLIYSLYQALTIPMTSLANQFIIGQYIGLSMIMFSLSIFLNVVIGYGKR
ncbi:cytochrome b [Sulfolobus acidocaldarius]|uniref:Cytochrome b n=4 Tax=Sulfolobus acidocaldarius TaxID=2285 RepID=Q4J6N5_SULAC|nr:cytochrome bc complex cytochrome b subunit [Sulfolobus acidocaldarius]AAY81546.1 cytochrome b [Sulfolobus acidocaldarius DSM 639]AGE72149.1 cytochrome b [Sulfolobus acidocaldarius N8]AGE74466.1 cytochrome b [Sulfolobus acidocaldarius Ron12/I]ALU30600.1 cytochrome B6 [Sulfolobus acidocaldarius]ALU32861.1 cytochrome B6 [Sulfolobus acidocaldarius]